jgi:[CysO sulfur-carrier protein]-S-L-cysteine hydrolase
MVSSPSRLILSPDLLAQVVGHARASRPKEAVGVLGGRSTGEVDLALPLVNMVPGERAFIADPHSQYHAFRRVEAERLEVLAIYHSHPGGGVDPSADDLLYARRWLCAHLIVALSERADGNERLRAFRFERPTGIEITEIPVIVHTS